MWVLSKCWTFKFAVDLADKVKHGMTLIEASLGSAGVMNVLGARRPSCVSHKNVFVFVLIIRVHERFCVIFPEFLAMVCLIDNSQRKENMIFPFIDTICHPSLIWEMAPSSWGGRNHRAAEVGRHAQGIPLLAACVTALMARMMGR